MTVGVENLSLLKPQGKLLRRLQGDAADTTASKIMNQCLRGFVQIELTPGSHSASATGDGSKHRLFIQAIDFNLVALGQRHRIGAQQYSQQFKGHLLLVESVAPNGTAGGQVIATLRDDDARPQNPGVSHK